MASHVRDRQRQVAEREAARLARPDAPAISGLAHASRKKSAVSSTPFGAVAAVSSATKGKKGAASSNGASSTWCGPFAVAREMIAQREEAKRERERELREEEDGENQLNHPLDAAMKRLEQEQQKRAHPALRWKSRLLLEPKDGDDAGQPLADASRAESIYVKRQKRADISAEASRIRVPSLYDLVVGFVVDHFDDVQSLGDVDHDIRSSIARELVARQKLDPVALEALLEPGLEALELIDCSQIPGDVLLDALNKLQPTLRYLVLDMCGRCVGPKAGDALESNGLLALSIGGAYLLKDADAARLLRSSLNLSSVEFKACPLLGAEFCRALTSPRPDASSSSLLELSLEDLPLDGSQLRVLCGDSDALTSLKSLSLRRFDAITDELVSGILERASNPDFHHLDLSHNYHLTDATLSAIRRHAGGIRSLALNGLKRLTKEGLEALFLPVPGVDETPPVLHSLELANLDHQAVTDDVIQLVCQSSSQQRDGDQGLERLNVQGSSAVTYAACEHLVQTSSHTLQVLNLSFCTQVTDQGLGYLVQHCRSLERLDIWGCAQVSDLFLDGHDRVLDASLVISGAWIKKNTKP